MWTCKACRVSFTFESVEEHVYRNHMRPKLGPLKLFTCGTCSTFDSERFEQMAQHCFQTGHHPSAVNKGPDYDQYTMRLFVSLEDTFYKNLQAPVLHDESRMKAPGPGRKLMNEESGVPQSNDSSVGVLVHEKNEVAARSENSTTLSSISAIDLAMIDGTSLSAESSNRHLTETPISWTYEELSDCSYDFDNSDFVDSESTGITQKNTTLGNSFGQSLGGLIADDRKRKLSANGGQIQRNGHKLQFKCSYCPKTSEIAAIIRVHERVHTGEKPFVCKTCGKKFNELGKMKIHERIHTGERPFTCNQCEKSFGHSTSLVAHIRIHTGERPYQCEICGARFNQNSAMRTHMKLKHKILRKKAMSTNNGAELEQMEEKNQKQEIKESSSPAYFTSLKTGTSAPKIAMEPNHNNNNSSKSIYSIS